MPSQTPIRTVTRDRSSFARVGAEAVIYDLSTSNLTVITIPQSSKWTSGPHWHETHTEYLQIVQGQAIISLGNSTWIHTPSDGVVKIKCGQVHEWRRNPGASGELIVKEWTDPADGQKEVFFRMLNSFLMEPEPAKMHDRVWPPPVERWLERYLITMQLFIIFATCDNWPVLFGQKGSFGSLLTHLAMGIVGIVGHFLLGLRPTYDEYVSKELWTRASRRGVASSIKDE